MITSLSRQWSFIFNLAFRLAVVEFSLRNEGSYLGNIWYLLNPVLLFLVLYFIFADRLGVDMKNYPVYLMLGILMYNFFSRTTLELTSVIKESGFIKSFAFPHEALILSVVLKHSLVHLFEIIVFFSLMAFLDISIITVLAYITVFIFLAVFVYGLGLILSTITVFFVDLGNIWQFFSLLLLFATPIFYAVEPGTFAQQINYFNPLYHFITTTRDLVIYNAVPPLHTIVAVIVSPLLVTMLGQIIFNKWKFLFPEKI